MRFRLSDADRERLGCPEWIDWDPSKLTNREAIALQKAGFDPPDQAIVNAWAAQFVQIDDERYRLERIDFEVWTAVVWMALHRAGVKVAYDDLEFDISGVRFELGEVEVDEGKDPSTPPETSSD